jgi:hypothetical protein
LTSVTELFLECPIESLIFFAYLAPCLGRSNPVCTKAFSLDERHRSVLSYVFAAKKNPRGAVQAYSGVFEVQRRVFIGLEWGLKAGILARPTLFICHRYEI